MKVRADLEGTVEELDDEVELLMLEQRAIVVYVRREFVRQSEASHFVLECSKHGRKDLKRERKSGALNEQRLLCFTIHSKLSCYYWSKLLRCIQLAVKLHARN